MKSKIFMPSLFVFASLAGTTAQADPMNLGDIVRNADGSVRHMKWIEADQYCRDQGSRLPTARELALYSQSLGARGIRDTAHVGVIITDAAVRAEIAQMRGDGYRPILTQNANYQVVIDFYFNYRGYRRPAGDLGNHWFWSSSAVPDQLNITYILSGFNGFIDYDHSYDHKYSAVRCWRQARCCGVL